MKKIKYTAVPAPPEIIRAGERFLEKMQAEKLEEDKKMVQESKQSFIVKILNKISELISK